MQSHVSWYKGSKGGFNKRREGNMSRETEIWVGAASSDQELKEARNSLPYSLQMESSPAEIWTDVIFLVSRTVAEKPSVVLSHQVVLICFSSYQNQTHLVSCVSLDVNSSVSSISFMVLTFLKYLKCFFTVSTALQWRISDVLWVASVNATQQREGMAAVIRASAFHIIQWNSRVSRTCHLIGCFGRIVCV